MPQGLAASTWAPPQGQQVHTPQPLGSQTYPPTTQATNTSVLPLQPAPRAEHSHFKPYQPLRSVHNYARYPSCRVNTSYRVSTGIPEKQVIEQMKDIVQEPPQNPTQDPRRYKLRQRHPDQLAPYTVAFEKKHPQTTPTSRYPLRSQQTAQSDAPSTGFANRVVPKNDSTRSSPARDWIVDVKPPVAPTPTAQYKINANLDPALRDVPARLLVVLDLNGTLLVRPNRNRPKHIIVRPGVPAFLDYLFRNHVVMVYSSAKPENCTAMIQQFFRPDQRSVLAAMWARDKLGLTPTQYSSKVQVYKKLEPIWLDKDIQKRAGPGRVWDQRNTVLVDDSKLKALAQPHNLLQIPEFVKSEPKTVQARLDWWREEEAIVQSVQQKLEELKFQFDVSRLIRQWQAGTRQAPGVVDETVDHKALQKAEGRAPSPTPTPSISDREASTDPQQMETPGASPVPVHEEDLPQYKPMKVEDDDVSFVDDEGVTLDDLEKDINRNLSLNQHPQIDGAASAAGSAATTERRSESIASRDVSTDPSRGRKAEARTSQTEVRTTDETKSSVVEGEAKERKEGRETRIDTAGMADKKSAK